MTAFRSLLFNIAFHSWTTLILVAGLPLLAARWQHTYDYGRFWAGSLLFLLRVLCGLRYELRGLENRPKGPAILAVKHQSAWDTLILPQIFDRPSYVVKKELTRIPLFGWYLAKCGMVPVDRKGGAKALRAMLTAARARVAEGRPIVIYPEGTRVAPGTRRPYHRGIVAIYRELGLPVVPVALNSGLYWRRRGFLKRPGCILLEVLPPLPPGLPNAEFMSKLEHCIEDASDALLREAEPAGMARPPASEESGNGKRTPA